MTRCQSNLRKDKRALSPAISSMILTAAVVVMLLVAMSYASGILNFRMADNEYNADKQFMVSTGKQIDDIAWTVGRTQTVTYSSKYGTLWYEEEALNYTFRIHTSSGWENLTVPIETGIILFNMPVSAYSLKDNYFERVPFTANSSFMLTGATAPITQVFCTQKVPMSDGNFLRIVLVPTMRVLSSTLSTGQTSYKFYLPTLENGTSPYRTQSLTLSGDGISKFAKYGVDQVNVTVTFPRAASLGLNSDFFNFQTTSILLNSTSTPKINSNSVVELYTGNVLVNIGLV